MAKGAGSRPDELVEPATAVAAADVATVPAVTTKPAASTVPAVEPAALASAVEAADAGAKRRTPARPIPLRGNGKTTKANPAQASSAQGTPAAAGTGVAGKLKLNTEGP
jgi:hypothetical protein